MTSGSGPYYPSSSQLPDLDLHQLRGDNGSIYHDTTQGSTSDAQMYALADDAMHAHQGHSSGHFAGLIQAATAAAGREGRHEHGAEAAARPRRNGHKSHPTQNGERGLKVANHSLQTDPYNVLLSPSEVSRKRKRGCSEDESAARDGAMPYKTRLATSDVRGTGGHVGSALFRRSSTASKKYTRPPMSKLFTSLELSPENFLQLQSAAKGYMLNGQFPDRMDTVGQRGKGDSELVKLRLWKCVKEFLELEGNGERFFGPHVPGDAGTPRSMIWPIHKTSIFGVVTPLLRRMVTNERQRQYAVEIRKGGPAATEHSNNSGGTRDVASGSVQELPYMPHEGTTHTSEVGLEGLFQDITGSALGSYRAWGSYGDAGTASRIGRLRQGIELSDTDFNGLIALTDYHIRISHNGDFTGNGHCNLQCEEETIQTILDSGHLDYGMWRCGDGVSVMQKRESARTILHDLFHILGNIIDPLHLPTDYSNDMNIRATVRSETKTSNAATPSLQIEGRREGLAYGDAAVLPETSLLLHLNLLMAGKRRRARVDVQADQAPSILTMLNHVARGEESVGLADVEVMVLLPDGLVKVNNDVEWAAALLSARSTDWMDKEMKVLIKVGVL